MTDRRQQILFLCTGNAARSVMARIMFAARCGDYDTAGAGTLVVPGHPMSVRTRNALGRFGLEDRSHRSNQLEEIDAAAATLLVAMEPEHVNWVRRNLPSAAGRTATMRRLIRDLPATEGDLAARVESLALDRIELEDWEVVVDPAAGDQEVFHDCAAELDQLVDQLIDALGAERIAG